MNTTYCTGETCQTKEAPNGPALCKQADCPQRTEPTQTEMRRMAAEWFECRRPPSPGAREMYRLAEEALRTVDRLQAEKDALVELVRCMGACEVCAHFDGFELCPDGLACAGCHVGCYCKDCTNCSKWEWAGLEGRA